MKKWKAVFTILNKSQCLLQHYLWYMSMFSCVSSECCSTTCFKYRRLQLSGNMSWENASNWLSNMICLDFKRHMILLQTFTFQLSTVNIPNLETHSYWAGIILQTLNLWLNSSELNLTYETGLSEVLTYCKFVSFDKFSIVCNVCTNFVTFSLEK
jgi:hypothetical protein